jgi:hypothetical protein
MSSAASNTDELTQPLLKGKDIPQLEYDWLAIPGALESFFKDPIRVLTTGIARKALDHTIKLPKPKDKEAYPAPNENVTAPLFDQMASEFGILWNSLDRISYAFDQRSVSEFTKGYVREGAAEAAFGRDIGAEKLSLFRDRDTRFEGQKDIWIECVANKRLAYDTLCSQLEVMCDKIEKIRVAERRAEFKNLSHDQLKPWIWDLLYDVGEAAFEFSLIHSMATELLKYATAPSQEAST